MELIEWIESIPLSTNTQNQILNLKNWKSKETIIKPKLCYESEIHSTGSSNVLQVKNYGK